jgi:exopolysaccharide biosynthesis protein
VFTFMHLWARPYWDLVDYHVLLRWQDDDDSEPVELAKDGTLQVPGDASPDEILLHLARHLERVARASASQGDARVPDAVS